MRLQDQANIASLERGLRNLRHAMAPSLAMEAEGHLPDRSQLTAWQARLGRWKAELKQLKEKDSGIGRPGDCVGSSSRGGRAPAVIP